MKTVPYFMLSTFIKENEVWRPRREDEMDPKFKLGLVQTPQSFYNPDYFSLTCMQSKVFRMNRISSPEK